MAKKLNSLLFEGNSEEDYQEDGQPTDTLVEKITEELELFHDTHHTPYVRFHSNDRTLTVPIHSEQFERYLQDILYKKTKKPVSKYFRQQVLDTLSSRAVHDSKQHEVHLRTAWSDDALMYDLGKYGVVKINKEGWVVLSESPLYFRTYRHQDSQCLPAEGGTLDVVFEFLNVKDDELKILLKTYLVAVLVPNIARPIVALHGPQGSAKSTALRLIKSLIDPSQIDLLTFPKESKELIQQLSHQYLLYYDNLSRMSEKQSDDLARTVTGSAFAKRKLYSDDEDHFARFRRAICINGINLVVTKPDLLDRALLIELERIPESKRVLENDLFEKFEVAKPLLLGAIFTALSKAMASNSVASSDNAFAPRLADYASWCQRIMVGLGLNPSDFVKAYRNNIERQEEETIDASALAQVVIDLVNEGYDLCDTPSGLYKTITIRADEMSLRYGAGIPRSASWLWKNLKTLEATLNSKGIGIERLDERPRKIRIFSL